MARQNVRAEHIQPQQEARYEGYAWEPLVKKYLANKSRVTLLEMAVHALKFEIDPPTYIQGESTRAPAREPKQWTMHSAALGSAPVRALVLSGKTRAFAH